MNTASSLQLLLWIWAGFGLVAFIGFTVLAATAVERRRLQNTADWWLIPTFLGAAASGSALFSIAVAAAAWPLLGLHICRVAGVVLVSTGIILLIRLAPAHTVDNPPGIASTIRLTRWSTAIGVALIASITWLAFQTSFLPSETPPTFMARTESGQDRLWASVWCGALLLFGSGASAFFFLFARRVNRGGMAKFESHWEGIGSGVGGWRMSSALGHLLVATALAVMFTFLLFRFDSRLRHAQVPDRAIQVDATPTPIATPH